VGSDTSSNSRRLVEVASRSGTPAYLVDGAEDVDPAWLEGTRTVAITAGASAPDHLVHGLVDALAALGPVEVEEHRLTTETLRFNLPREVDPR
jgi:4-hydroxy-3-methylbut-2-enyl diphosphate reductase